MYVCMYVYIINEGPVLERMYVCMYVYIINEGPVLERLNEFYGCSYRLKPS